MGWQITYDGHTYRQGELSIADAEAIDSALSERWAALAPAQSPGRLAGVVAWLHARRTDTPFHEAATKVGAVGFIDLLNALEDEQEDLPTEYSDGFPPPADNPTTSG